MADLSKKIIDAIDFGLKEAINLDDIQLDDFNDITIVKNAKTKVKQKSDEFHKQTVKYSFKPTNALIKELNITKIVGFEEIEEDTRTIYRFNNNSSLFLTMLKIDSFIAKFGWYVFQPYTIDTIKNDTFENVDSIPQEIIKYIKNNIDKEEYNGVKTLYLSPSLGCQFIRYEDHIDFCGTGNVVYQEPKNVVNDASIKSFLKILKKYKVFKNNNINNCGMIFDYDETGKPYCYVKWFQNIGTIMIVPDLLVELTNYSDGILENENFKLCDSSPNSRTFISLDKNIESCMTSYNDDNKKICELRYYFNN